ncbi:hypothetical protein [Modestobacter excelsi]|uniref:hypothetical protein n=1 Tax=Modestobacter excelsi TaxID=2213161 RepID=UPI00110D1EB9|nr:hypothetical protein [Modestobacter excelsi]
MSWSTGQDADNAIIPALTGQSVEHLAAAGGLTVAAGDRQIAVLTKDAVVARWETQDEITAVALSPDAAALGVATRNMTFRIWRIDAPQELRLTSYTADSPDGDDLLGVDPIVDALAALVSARALQPPLSVGLLGRGARAKRFLCDAWRTG